MNNIKDFIIDVKECMESSNGNYLITTKYSDNEIQFFFKQLIGINNKDYYQVISFLDNVLISICDKYAKNISDAYSVYSKGPQKVFTTNFSDFNLSLSNAMINKLINEAHDGSEDSRNKLIDANARLIKKMSEKYMYVCDLSDVTEMCIMGLVKAIEIYDTKSGIDFLTYASWWIDQAIARIIIDKSNELGVSLKSAIKGYNKSLSLDLFKDNLSIDLDKNDSENEMVRLLDNNPRRIKRT